MTLAASLRNRVRRLEARAVAARPVVMGVVLRPGMSAAQAHQCLEAATAQAATVYVANLARLRFRKD